MTEKDYSPKAVPEKTAEPAKPPRRLSDSPHPSALLSETTPSLAAGARPDVVVFKNVTKSFGAGREAKVAIQDISFVVEDAPHIGELVTVVGPSGCGKSTLLRIIAALKPHFPPTSGEVQVLGRPVLEPGPDRGLVDQKYSLLPHLRLVENIAFGLKLRGIPRRERLDRAQDWVRKVGLDGCEDK